MKQEQQIFKLHSEYQPTGDQPQAIAELVKGFQGRQSVRDPAWRYRLRQDVYDGECDCSS